MVQSFGFGVEAWTKLNNKPWACSKGHTEPQEAVPDQVQDGAQSYEGAVEVEAVQQGRFSLNQTCIYFSNAGIETLEVRDQEAGQEGEDTEGSNVQSPRVRAEKSKNIYNRK